MLATFLFTLVPCAGTSILETCRYFCSVTPRYLVLRPHDIRQSGRTGYWFQNSRISVNTVWNNGHPLLRSSHIGIKIQVHFHWCHFLAKGKQQLLVPLKPCPHGSVGEAVAIYVNLIWLYIILYFVYLVYLARHARVHKKLDDIQNKVP